MLLKRSIVLAAGVLLFITAYIIYFDVSKMQMEDRFKAERVKYGVQGVTLTSATPPTSPDAASSSTTTPASTAAPAAPDANSTPAPARSRVNRYQFRPGHASLLHHG